MERNKRKTRIGIVVSDKMNKTRVVDVYRTFRHALYDKVIRQKKRYYAHDEKNESHIGDKVKIMEVRPLSRLKRWTITEIVEKYRE